MKSEAKTIEEYLQYLPEERKEAISTVRDIIIRNLPSGFEEVVNWGMICYQVPFSVYPDTYNKQPLMYAALASQKNHMAVYLTSIYMSENSRKAFEKAYKATGKKFDTGKSCVRFRKLDDLPLSLIGETIASLKLREFVEKFKTIQSARKSKN